MKPNFALILSSKGISLLHRAVAGVAEGWNMLGDASLEGDDPGTDLGATLAALREKAAQFDPSGLHCTLVLPDDQIKYISLPRADISEDDPQKTALEALEGATPYAVDALVVDWSLAQDQLHIAAVARETLTEAENFVSGHGFDPVCFVASPETGDFTGAPYFGVTSSHDAGDPVERDETPVRVTGSAFMPKTEIVRIAESEPEPETEQPDTPDDTTDTNQPVTDTPQDEAPDAEPAAAFASIRAHHDDLPDAAPKLAGAARFFAAEGVNPPSVEIDPDTAKTPSEPDFSGVTDAGLPGEPTPEPEEQKPPVVAQAAPALAATSSDLSTNQTPQPPRITPADPAPEPSNTPGNTPSSEKARMTVFGARDPHKSGTIPEGAWLILAAIAVIPIIGLAVLASMTFEDGLAGLFHSPDRVKIADIPDPVSPPSSETTTPEITDLSADKPAQETAPPTDVADETTADQAIDQAVIASLEPANEATDEPTDESPEAISPAQEVLTLPDPIELTPDEARARYAATGIWQMAPINPQAPSAANLENLHQASIDNAVNRKNAITLPALPATATDTRPQTPLSPPKAGIEFNLDSRGLVIATKEGALTPEGVRVYAGQPSIRPPARPGTPAQSATTGTTVDPERLQKARPRPRPDDLIEQHERSALGGRTVAELAKLRPKLRPQSAQEAAALAAAGAGSAIDAAVSEAAQSGLSAQTITASLRPATRPEGFSDTVAQIRAAQLPEVTPGQPLDASAVAVVTPTIPTSASIARAATDTNAIKLRKINLIGVYGTPNSRRALVRLPNGRYRKLVIGDRLDGGKVAAIGDTELRYIKRGRSVVLKMPQG
jgi:hypothetical protein